MGRKANHKHVKGMSGKRVCNNPCMHRRKGTTRRACRRKTKAWRETKGDKDLNTRMQAWAANKRAQPFRNIPIDNKEYVM